MAYDNPASITHSKIAQASCLARYHKLHVLGMADTSDPARRGSTVHTAHEKYLAALVQAGEPSDSDLAARCLHDAIVEENCPAHLVPDCEYLWANHTERWELDLDAFLEAEQRRTVGAFSFKPDFAYVYPDRLEIHDLKTQYQALTPDAAKRDLQARMYCYLASQVWPGFEHYVFVWHFIRLNQVVEQSFGPSDLDTIKRQLDAHAEAIQNAHDSGVWPASPGAQCAYCTFACDLVDDAARTPARILGAAEAARIASNLVLLQAAVAHQTRALSEYAALNGPVTAADHEFAHRPYERKTYSAGPTLALLAERGADTRTLSFGATALRPYLTAKKWATLTPDLEELARIKTGTTFSAKKLAGAEDAPPAEAE